MVRRASQVIPVCSCSPRNGGCGFSEEYGWYHILIMSRQRSEKYSATFGRAMLAVLVAIEAPARYYRRFMAMRIDLLGYANHRQCLNVKCFNQTYILGGWAVVSLLQNEQFATDTSWQRSTQMYINTSEKSEVLTGARRNIAFPQDNHST